MAAPGGRAKPKMVGLGGTAKQDPSILILGENGSPKREQNHTLIKGFKAHVHSNPLDSPVKTPSI